MEIRIRQSGEVVTDSQFRAAHKNTSLPRQLTEQVLDNLGADVVFEGPQASGGDHYQYSQRQGVEQLNGKWYTKHVLGPIFTDNEDATAAQQEASYKAGKDAEQAKSVRAERDRLLAECDWVTIKAIDASADGLGIQLPQVWIDYRKALRDVPTQAGFPWTVTWPEKP